MTADLEHARHLAAHGVPVFLARPALDDSGEWDPAGGTGGSGYLLPKGWQDTTADPAVLDAYRPGMAVCAVMGHGVDGLDVDPRHEGDRTRDGLAAAGLWPRSYGRARTPSGGTHDLIRSLSVASRDNVAPGLDVKAGHDGRGHGFLFIAPTVKLSKATGELAAYRWESPPDLDALDALDDTGRTIAGMIAASRTPTTPTPAPSGPRTPTPGTTPYGATALDHEAAAVATAPVGERNATLNRAAFRLGQLVPHEVTEHDVRDALSNAARACGLTSTETAATIRSGLDAGKGQPRTRAQRDLDRLVPPIRSTSLPDATFPTVPDVASGDALSVDGGITSSWTRVDLTATLDGLVAGTLARPAPTVAAVDGGTALFYRGKVNGLAGESGAGKTWTVLHAAAAIMAKGQPVVYVDHEDDAAGIVSRLLDLDVAPDAIGELFCYLNPSERPTASDLAGLVGLVAELQPALVVVDSTGEGLALDGANPNADEDVAAWFLRVPRRVAVVPYGAEPGPAVVVLDHVTKTDDGGLWPIGSQRKRAAISGVQYMQRTVRPFNQDTAGHAVIVCAKDRHGHYRAGQRVAELHVAPGPCLTLRSVTDAAGNPFRPTVLMERVSRFLEDAPEPASSRTVRERVQGKKDAVLIALGRLVSEGYVRAEAGPRNATLHTSVRPFRDAGGQSDDETCPRALLTGPGPKDGGRGASHLTGPRGPVGASGGRIPETGPCHLHPDTPQPDACCTCAALAGRGWDA